MRQAQGSTEEGFNTFEMIRIQIGLGALEGLRLLVGFGRVFRGLLAQGSLHLMVPMER